MSVGLSLRVRRHTIVVVVVVVVVCRPPVKFLKYISRTLYLRNFPGY